MATLARVLSVGDEIRLGESAGTSISIPTKQLLLGQKMGFLKTTEIPDGFSSISSIQLRFLRTGTGTLYLKFGCSHISQTSGSTPTEDVDSYTEYAITGDAGDIQNVTIPASAYNGLTGMVAGDTLAIGAYRDASGATDTYTTDLEVVEFLIIFTIGTTTTASTGDRSQKILGKVLFTVGNSIPSFATAFKRIGEQVIYDIMKDYSVKIAQETMCLEKSGTLTIASSAATEPTGLLRLKLIELGTNLYLQMFEIDIEDYDNLSRRSFSGIPQTPMYYKRWNGTITVYPAVTSDSYTVYYIGIPTTTPSSSVDPETPEKFDKAIEYGVVSEVATMFGNINLATMYMRRYDQELQKVIQYHSKANSRILELASHE